jgi:hypothetical protein
VLRLSLVSADVDRELDAIRQTLDAFDEVSGLDDVLAVLERHGAAELVDLVDLIGHSARGFLALGSWLVDDSPQTAASFVVLVRPLLRRLGVRTIRLLGCSTATTEPGRKALWQIAQATRCDLFGTSRYVSKHDYAATGFAREDCLIRARSETRDRMT